MHRKLIVATVVAALALAATAVAAAVQHSTGNFKGRTTQGSKMNLNFGAKTVRGGKVDVLVTCVRNGRRMVLPDTATIAGGIPINQNGTFGARQHSRHSDFELRIAGEVKGRHADGRYQEKFSDRFGKCQSGRVFFKLNR